MQSSPPPTLTQPADSPTRRAILTVVTQSHLSYALTLARSCLAQETHCNVYITVVDCLSKSELQKILLGTSEDLDTINWLTIEELNLPDWQRMAFQYTPFEFVCACKAFAMRTVAKLGNTHLVYLDADMWLFQPMEDVWQELKTSSILLTPHLVQPLPNDDLFPSESEYLRCGTFNGGFMAIHNDAEGEAMLEWWCNRMSKDCIVDIAAGIFVDQKWLNLVPGLFSTVKSLRNPGYNAGHWSLSQNSISLTADGHFTVGHHPLVLFHFSKFLPDDPYSFERQQSRIKLKAVPALATLLEGYWGELAKTILPKTSLESRFARLSCHTLIEPSWREAVRRGHTALSDVANPFDSSTTRDLVQRYRNLESESADWRLDWKYAKKRSTFSKAWKKCRRRLVDWWRHR